MNNKTVDYAALKKENWEGALKEKNLKSALLKRDLTEQNGFSVVFSFIIMKLQGKALATNNII